MKKHVPLFSILLLSFVTAIKAQDWKTYPYQPLGSVLTFPDDEGFHPGEPIEWWYLNGRVTGQLSGKEYSFMLTYFHYPALVFDGFRILNLADETNGQFYAETLPATYSLLAEDHLGIRANVIPAGIESWTTLTDGQGNFLPFQYKVQAGGQHGALDLELNTIKRPLIVGGTGFLNQGSVNYTYYYSQTGVEVSGMLNFKGFSEPVSGIAWIDRQYGDFNPNTGEKYEWFSLQLSNGTDINLWNIFTDQRQIPEAPTYRFLSAYVDESTSITSSDFTLDRLGFQWMPDETLCYARQWRLRSEALQMDLIITTRHDDHEVLLPFRFFEGTTTITGTIAGQPVTGNGFAELLHHYEHPSIRLVYPTADEPWEAGLPITWSLLNPDDGRTVFYDVEIRTANEPAFTALARGLTDTTFSWQPSGLSPDSLYWLRIVGYSADSTLVGMTGTEVAMPIVTPVQEAVSAANDLQVFPNPASGQVFLSFDKPLAGRASILLRDLSGRVLHSIDTGGGISILVFPLNDYPAGMYLLDIQQEAGRILRPLVLIR